MIVIEENWSFCPALGRLRPERGDVRITHMVVLSATFLESEFEFSESVHAIDININQNSLTRADALSTRNDSVPVPPCPGRH